jgi:predicted nucleic acid-binding protein
MRRYRVILDTNVVLAAMRSKAGASYRLLLTLGHPRWQSVITPALLYEYEEVVRRSGSAPGLSPEDITNILNLLYQDLSGIWSGFPGGRPRLIPAMT